MNAFKTLLLLLCSLPLVRAADYTESVLVNLQGVGLELRPLNVRSEQFDLQGDALESHAYGTLSNLGVRLFSTIELDVMPGEPYLEISVDVAHAQGPSHLFVARLELREMTRLERPKDRTVRMALPTWERKVIGVANRPEAVVEAVDSLLKLFADEYHEMNPKDD